MEPTKYREAFERAYRIVEIIRRHEEEGNISVDIGFSGETRICYFPPEDRKEEATRFALKEFGKLTKDSSGNLEGIKGDVKLILFSVLKCELVGYKTEKRAKLVESGDFEEVKTPIYECRSPIVKEVVELANQN
jgi:hypothetical protein